MRIFDVMLKDLMQIFRDWKAALFLVLMPIAFTILMGFVFSGVGASESDPRLPVGILLPDGDPVAETLVTLLELSDVVRPVLFEGDAGALAQGVADEEFAAAVIVPAGYGAQAAEGRMVPVEVVASDASNAGHMARTAIDGALFRLHGAVQAATLTMEALATADPNRYADLAARRAHFYALLEESVAAWETPPFGVQTSLATSLVSEEEPGAFDNPYSHSSAGMMVQFAIAGLIGAAEVVVRERTSRTLQRLLTTAITRAEVIAGHFLAMFVMILLQVVLLMSFGQWVLGVAYFHAPLASLLMALAFAFFVGAMGMLIGAVAQSEEQTIILSLFPMFILSGLGGAWMPLETSSETFQRIGHLMPTAWAMDGLKNITVRGLGVESVLLPALILFGAGLVCLALSVWQFRVER